MNRKDLDTDILYNGKDILDFAINNIFREGDKLIAIQDDIISKYIYIKNPNDSFDFFDEEYEGTSLDMFDLINCKFIILLNNSNKNYVGMASYIGAFDVDLFNKNYMEMLRMMADDKIKYYEDEVDVYVVRDKKVTTDKKNCHIIRITN